MTSKLDKELTNRLGNSSIESCIQRAESWIKVSALLDELVPDWKNDSATTRGGEALNAISGLVTRIAELESERDDDQLLNKYAVCISGSVTQYVYSRVNCDAQSVRDRLVDRHHYNPNISVHFVACEVERAAHDQ